MTKAIVLFRSKKEKAERSNNPDPVSLVEAILSMWIMLKDEEKGQCLLMIEMVEAVKEGK